jgi:hypothetical protein
MIVLPIDISSYLNYSVYTYYLCNGYEFMKFASLSYYLRSLSLSLSGFGEVCAEDG